VILGTHPTRTGMLMLEHKGIPYRGAPSELRSVLAARLTAAARPISRGITSTPLGERGRATKSTE
jgi:hypothetical protein